MQPWEIVLRLFIIGPNYISFMKITILIVLFAFCTLSLSSQGRYQENRVLTDTEKIAGLSRLWEGVKNNFVYYDQLTFSWDSLYVASIQKVLDTKDTYSYIKELERIVASVKDGHTYIMHNIAPDWEERIMPVPFTTRFVEGKVVVDKVWSTELLDKGVKRGVEVVSIDGVDVLTYGEKVIGQYIPFSSPQWLHHIIFNEYNLTKGHRTIPVTISFYNGKKKTTITIDRSKRWDIQEKERSSGKTEANNYSTLTYTTLD